jgi:hypothetical protein
MSAIGSYMSMFYMLEGREPYVCPIKDDSKRKFNLNHIKKVRIKNKKRCK